MGGFGGAVLLPSCFRLVVLWVNARAALPCPKARVGTAKGAYKHSKKARAGTARIRKGAFKHSKKARAGTAGRSKSACRYSKRRVQALFCLKPGSLTGADKRRMLVRKDRAYTVSVPVRSGIRGGRLDSHGGSAAPAKPA